MLKDVTFAYPWVLYFLIIVPLMLVWYWFKGKQKQPSITYSSLSIFRNIAFSWRERFRHVPIILRVLAVALLIIATASTRRNRYCDLRKYAGRRLETEPD